MTTDKAQMLPSSPPGGPSRGPDMVINVVQGATLAACWKSLSSPIMRVKLVLQAQDASRAITPENRFKGLIGTFSRLIRQQGVTSLWRGNVAAILTHLPQQMTTVALSHPINRRLTSGINRNKSPIKYFLASIASGAVVGGTTIFIVYPLDFARTRLALDMGKSKLDREFTGIAKCWSAVSKVSGIRGLYRGFFCAFQGVIVYRGLTFGLFEAIHGYLWSDPKKAQMLPTGIIAQAVTFISGTVTYPFDTVVRRMMMQSGQKQPIYRSTFDCWKKIIRLEGVRGFYKGYLCSILNGVFGGLTLLMYSEYRKRF